MKKLEDRDRLTVREEAAKLQDQWANGRKASS
jgi:hypothetical protein